MGKPDWDRLASEFEGDPQRLIADVDCTAAGKPLCEKYGVQGYPTIKTFAAVSPERRQGRINKLQNALKKEEARHKEVQEGLQKRYEESNSALEALKESLS